MRNFCHSESRAIRFADCDPAGIVYCSRFFEWFDRCFHGWLWSQGGHQSICDQLGLVGIGLITADVKFLTPGRDGDDVVVDMTIAEWGARSLTLEYKITAKTRIATGYERRGLFQKTKDGLTTAPATMLREFLDG